jgi:hypothetical protein
LRKLAAGEYDFVLVRQGISSVPPIPISPPPNGGIFVWDDVSPEDDNYGTIIVPKVPKPTGKGRWKRLYTSRLNVKWFNAKGDGVTDDLAALKLAAAAAKTLNADLEIPLGKYLVSGPWVLSGATRKVMGTGEVTIQRANPQELAKLSQPATKGDAALRVSSTIGFFNGQIIQIACIDAGHHLAIDVRTVASVGVDVVNLTSPLSQTFATGPVSDEGCVITTGLIDEVIQFDASVVNASLENIKVLGIGSLVLGVKRFGIGYKGTGALRCVNVESTNHSEAGVAIYSGTGQFSFVGCNMHDNGYAGIYGAPIGGSVEVIGGNYSNNGPEWSGSSAYGMTLNGSKTIVIGAKCENNCANQIDVHSTQNKSVLIVQGCTLAWGASNGDNMPGGMVSLSGECETLIVEGCDMDGHRAVAKQMYGVAAGGFQVYRKGVGASEVGQNQETIRVVNNVFRNMNCSATSVYLTPWDVKDVEVVSNTFINCSSSIIVDNQEVPGCFDPFTAGKPNDLTGFDKRKIPDIVRIVQNTFVDSGRCYVTCGGLVVYVENLFIRKYLGSYTIAPFVVGTIVGRVGRVIRRNNRAIGLESGVFAYTPTTAALPSHYHWSVGDQESNEAPTLGIYQGYVCTVAGTAETSTSTGTKATTHKDTTTIDVDDCTLFCPQQWIMINDGANLVKFRGAIAVRILRVIGIGAKTGGRPGQLIVEFPADIGVEKQEIKFQKAIFQTINASELLYGNSLRVKVDETGIGVFGVKPIARPPAYKQTYSATARTMENDTAADLVTTSATQVGPYGFSSAAQANDIAIEFNKLRADLLALKKVVNSIIDDQQAYGWFQ